jgi:hypothetical protein
VLNAASLGVGFIELFVLKHLELLLVHPIATLFFFGLHLIVFSEALSFDVFDYFLFVVQVLYLRPVDLANHFFNAFLYDFFIFKYFIQNLVFALFFFVFDVFCFQMQSSSVYMGQNVS